MADGGGEQLVSVGQRLAWCNLWAKSSVATRYVRVYGSSRVLESVKEALEEEDEVSSVRKGEKFLVVAFESPAAALKYVHSRPLGKEHKVFSQYLPDVLSGGTTDGGSSSSSVIKPFFRCWSSEKVDRCVETLPAGLHLFPDFATAAEEAHLLHIFDQLPWLTPLKRRVQHYGYCFQYQGLQIDHSTTAAPLPPDPQLHHLIRRIVQAVRTHAALPTFRPDQLTVNEYLPGQGIGFHVDTHSSFTEAIIVVSLNSGLNMEFRPMTKNAAGSEVHLPARSLCIFAHQARYGWFHGIKSRRTDTVPPYSDNVQLRHRRVSLTFRQLNWQNYFRCLRCGYPQLCDTQNPASLVLPDRLSSNPDRTTSDPDRITSDPTPDIASPNPAFPPSFPEHPLAPKSSTSDRDSGRLE